MKSFGRSTLLLFALSCFSLHTYAQGDDLLSILDEEETTNYATATFKGTRIVNLQSTEIPGAGVGQFVILHRFGAINDDPLYNLFGLDVASVRLSMDYSFNDYINVGIGRSSGSKTYDSWLKAKLLRQSSGAQSMPISLLYYGSFNVNTTKYDDGIERSFFDRASYVNQLIIARKFTASFSFEVAPTLVHWNTRQTEAQPNSVFALGGGMRYKITNRIALTAETMIQMPQNTRLVDGVETPYENSFSIGVDIETGGHVFQLHLTNSRFMSDPDWMAATPGSWGNGDIFFGFNISRVFTLRKPKVPEDPNY